MSLLRAIFPVKAIAQLFHGHSDPMWIHDAHTLEILEVNKAGLAQYGYSRDEFLALTLSDISPPEGEKATSGSLGLAAEEASSTQSHCRKAGTVFLADVLVQAVEFDGRPARLVMARDLTGAGSNCGFADARLSLIPKDPEACGAETESAAHLAKRLQSVLVGMSDGLFLVDRDWRLLCVNPAAAALVARPQDELDGCIFWSEFPEWVGTPLETAMHEARLRGDVQRLTIRTASSGRSLAFTVQPGVESLAVYFRNVSADVDTTEQRRLIDLAVSRLNDIVMITDAEPSSSGLRNQIIYVNDAVQQVTGYSPDQLIGQTPRMLQGPGTEGPELEKLHEAIRKQNHVRVELVNYNRAGSPHWVEISLSPVFDLAGRCTNFISVQRDITARKNAERSLQLAATRDSLTGLLNRAALMDILRNELEAPQAADQALALIFIDCDNFKTVNDTLGHAVGDTLLAAVAFRLSEVISHDAWLARIGGDEFLVLARLSGENDALQLAEKLREAILAPFILAPERISMTASIGLAIGPVDGRTADQLIQNADIAMFHSKDQGCNEVTRFNAAMQSAMVRQAGLTQSLQQSLIERTGFRLHYQPQFSLDGMLLIGAEALLRWQDADRGEIAPSEFIAVAEKAGLIRMLDRMVIDLAAAQLAEWRGKSRGLKISVNVSPLSLRQGDIASYIIESLAHHSISPDQLGVEITESASFDYHPTAMNNIQRLRDAGVSIAIDDFGTGHSSLSYLQRLPIDVIKIDQSFIHGLTTRPERDEPLVKAILAMASALNLRVVAEGAETEAEVSWLARHGADAVQGYWTGGPVNAEEFVRLHWSALAEVL